MRLRAFWLPGSAICGGWARRSRMSTAQPSSLQRPALSPQRCAGSSASSIRSSAMTTPLRPPSSSRSTRLLRRGPVSVGPCGPTRPRSRSPAQTGSCCAAIAVGSRTRRRWSSCTAVGRPATPGAARLPRSPSAAGSPSRSTLAAMANPTGLPDGDYRLSAFARDLDAALAALTGLPAKPVVVGASLGGLTSILLAGESSGRARRPDPGRHRPRHGARRRRPHPGLHGRQGGRRLRLARRGRRRDRRLQPAPAAPVGPFRAAQEPARARRPLVLALGPEIHRWRRGSGPERDHRRRAARRSGRP